MKQKLLLLFFIFNVVFIGNGLLSHAFAQNVWNGKKDISWYNTSDKSFEISTAEQLAGLADLVNKGNSFSQKTIVLTSDILLNDVTNIEDWKTTPPANEWNTIGQNKEFMGTFDGKEYTVKGLYIGTAKQYNGLFGQVKNAVIKNLNVSDFLINGHKYNGGLVGYGKNSSFIQVGSQGKIIATLAEGNSDIGGLIGHCDNSNVKNSYSKVIISISGAASSIGGFIGNNQSTEITNVYNIGSIFINGAGDHIGGLIGYNKNASVTNAYTITDISGTTLGNVGSFIGYFHGNGKINSCYYNSDISANKAVGGENPNKNRNFPSNTSSELRKKNTFIDWNFTDIWQITNNKNNGYPYLLMEKGNSSIVYPDILHVKVNGDKDKDGSDWANAISLKKALEVLNSSSYKSSNRLQIRIAKGDYHTEGKAFEIKNSVLIYGGFSEVDSATAENTILYGGDNNRVLIIYNKDKQLNVTIEGVKIMEGTAHDEVADLTLNPDETTKYRGGGIFNANANTTLNEVIITDNTAGNKKIDYAALGGGIYNHSGKLTLRNCLVSNNISAGNNNEGKGGGIYLDEGTAETTIHGGSVISQNSANKGTGSGSGGGIYITRGSAGIRISKSSIINNIAINNANNAASAQGGGIYNEKRNLMIDATMIMNNTATIGKGNGSGGGIYHPFLLDPENQTTITLDNSEISGNTAFKNTDFVATSNILKGSGGGIYFGEGSIVFHECKLQKNVAAHAGVNEKVGGNGGAVYNVAGHLTMEACEVLENTATNANGFGYGGGISNMSDKEIKLFNTLIAKNIAGKQALGGGIFNTTGKNVTLTNVTIAGNSAGQQGVVKRSDSNTSVGGGSGIYNYSKGHISLENTIIWHNKEEDGIVQYLDDGATHVSGYCLVSGFKNSDNQCDTVKLDGRYCASNYPKFIDSANHNYRLRAASPLRNLAQRSYIENNTWDEPDKDLDDNARIDRALDLGAYESNPFNITLTNSNEFGYHIPDSIEKYGIISSTEYEVDPDSSFVFALRVKPGIIYSAVVKANGQNCQPGVDNLYTIKNITEDINIEVLFTADKYTVTMPKVDGVITDSVAGVYQVESGKDFIFSLKLEDGYSQSTPVVKANNNVITSAEGKYKIAVSSNVTITIEDVKQNEYTVKLPQVTGISTTPVAGNYTIPYDSTFNFTITKKDGYEKSNLLITADQGYQVETVDATLGKYRIKNTKHNINISIALTQSAVHTVTLKTISDIQTTPKAGQYTREDGKAFDVTFAIPEKYEARDIEVELDGSSETFDHVVGNTYTYTIPNVKKNHTISILKYKRYQIHLNKTAGVLFSPSAGTHKVGKYDNFSFTITLEKNYNQSTFKVYANNSEITPDRIKGEVYTYTLSNIQKDYNITIEGVKRNDGTGNDQIEGKVRAYNENKTLFVHTDDAAILAIYTINGHLYKHDNIPAGTTKMTLPAGVYIVKVNNEIFKIII